MSSMEIIIKIYIHTHNVQMIDFEISGIAINGFNKLILEMIYGIININHIF